MENQEGRFVYILDENNLIYINGMQSIENIFVEVLGKIEEFRKKNDRRIWKFIE